jgi:hypothetical protein
LVCRIAYNFVGIRFLSELLPEIAQAISEAKEGEVMTNSNKTCYHILKLRSGSLLN